MTRPSTEECIRLIENGVVTAADTDISGIGVILAFHISAYVTFTAVLIGYAFGIIDDQLLAPVDRRVFHVTSRTRQFPRSQATLRKFILTLSDNQIVTGIAILAAGFRGLRKGDISVYHYQVVLYLAWLSSSVHLSAISLLRPYLADHFGLKTWRLVGMMVLFVMLLIGLVPTISHRWGIANPLNRDDTGLSDAAPNGWGVPAVCFWGRTYGEGVNSDAPLGYAILIVSYLWKIGDMLDAPRDFYHRRIRRPAEAFVERCLSAIAKQYAKQRNCFYIILFRMLMMMILPGLAFTETMVSFSASLWLSALGLVFGTIQVLIPRNQNLVSTAGEEDEWKFGQLVPLILLIQPLGVLIENMIVPYGRTQTSRRNERNDDDSEYEMEAQGPQNPTQDHLSPSRNSMTTAHTRQSHEPLITALAGQHPTIQIVSDIPEDQPSELQAVMMASRLFGLLVGVLHASIFVGAMIIFYINAQTIGFDRGENWIYLVIAIVLYIMASWGLVGMLGPFSRLWKSVK
ncbi:hypothetical protein Q7P37_010366 [Cladosporium fusiforme]